MACFLCEPGVRLMCPSFTDLDVLGMLGRHGGISICLFVSSLKDLFEVYKG